VLIALADYESPTGEIYPKQKTLAADCGMTREAVNRHIKKLLDLGLITVTHQKREDGSFTSNLYHLCRGTPTDDHTVNPSDRVIEAHTNNHSSLKRENNIQPKESTPLPPSTKKTTPTDDPFTVPIPDELDDQEFRQLWFEEWIPNRIEKKKPLTARAAKMALHALCDFDIEWACRRIREAIARGWLGLVFESDYPKVDPDELPEPSIEDIQRALRES
jgi:DNA-binding transcriptional ArsR family regulator